MLALPVIIKINSNGGTRSCASTRMAATMGRTITVVPLSRCPGGFRNGVSCSKSLDIAEFQKTTRAVMLQTAVEKPWRESSPMELRCQDGKEGDVQ